MKIKALASFLFSLGFIALQGQNPNMNYNKFKQLNEELPTPNVYRTASGAPGEEYYQNYANYTMDIVLDDEKATITGSEKIHYVNK